MLEIYTQVEFYDFIVAQGTKSSPVAPYPESIYDFAEAVIQACRTEMGLEEWRYQRRDSGQRILPGLATGLLGSNSDRTRPVATFRIEFAARIFTDCATTETAYRTGVAMIGLAHNPNYLIEAQADRGSLLISRPAFEEKFGATVCVAQQDNGGVFYSLGARESRDVLKEKGYDFQPFREMSLEERMSCRPM